MPSSISSSSSPYTISPNPPQKLRTAKTKKSRAIRRRGRARAGIESDDEIERVISTDSESDSDVSLSPDSATDSEPDSEDEDGLPDRQIDAHTPNTSHSSGALDKEGNANEKSTTNFFSTSGNWSEIVADENANGTGDLPVIEFSDFKTDVIPTQISRKKIKKSSKKKPSATGKSLLPPVIPDVPLVTEPLDGDAPQDTSQGPLQVKDFSRRSSSQPKRPVGQSARQLYQQKLENDPSFVPKVGGFWGHDDRLMDKDLRSLSGWWRGKWQGRGRGRGGFASGFGRRGSYGGEEDKDETVNLPPIERPWTHDGFEEMKRKEEQRFEARSEGQPQRQTTPLLRGAPRGRGGTPATRGSRGGPSRGGFVNLGNRASTALKPGRIWYTMKPEHMWTKQSENFLFFEPKHRGPGPSYRVQLPDSQTQTIRPITSNRPLGASNNVATATVSVVGSDVGDKVVIVKLPKCEEELPTIVHEASLDDVFRVRPRLINAEPIPLPAPSNTKSSPPAERPNHCSQSSLPVGEPSSDVKSQLELTLDAPSADPSRLTQTEKAVLRSPAAEAPTDEIPKSPPSQSTSRRPSLPPIQTVYTPPPAQPSPAYPTSYAYPTLPPGIALNQHGVPYEMATGRPVYIPSAAPSVYNSRPIMHSHLPQHSLPYISPPHMHPSSAMSPDFSAQLPSHSHTPTGFIDPATGVPIFSLPRSSRVEIRAPGEAIGKSDLNGSSKPPSVASPGGQSSTHFRISSHVFVPSSSHPGTEYGYNSYSSSSDVSTLPSYASLPDAGTSEAGTGTTQPVVHYPTYQQYYYPDPAYGYPQYMDVSQAGQYGMYPPMEAHGTTYY